VVDSKTGLKWRRCSEGQTWDGSTCAGAPLTYTHEEALRHAQTQTGWRLPGVKELSSIADKDCNNPAIDNATFPNTTSSYYWTSTPFAYKGKGTSIWLITFRDGGIKSQTRDSYVPVRLLRAVK
jgi:hypothetical protein